MGCTFCRVTLTFVIGLAGLAAGYFLGAGIAAALGIEASASTIANWSEVIGFVVGLGIGIVDLASYLCCRLANCKEYCPKGATEFWTAYANAVQSTNGHLTSKDCKHLTAVINGLVTRGQIDDAAAETLRRVLSKRCPD